MFGLVNLISLWKSGIDVEFDVCCIRAGWICDDVYRPTPVCSPETSQSQLAVVSNSEPSQALPATERRMEGRKPQTLWRRSSDTRPH